MSYELTNEQKQKDAKRAKYWAQYDHVTKRDSVTFKNYQDQQAWLRRREAQKRQKVLTDADIAYRYITDRMYTKTRCINYYLFFDSYAYISLNWAVKVGVPSSAWYEDETTEMVTLTPYGLQWVLRYLLRKYGVLIIRPLSLKDRFILSQKTNYNK